MKPETQRRKIIEGLREMSLGEVLSLDEMPQRSTVLRWIREDQDFAVKCLDARRDRAEFLLEQVQRELMASSSKDAAIVAQAKIRHLEWYLERINPILYGRRVQATPTEGVAALLADARKRAESRTIEAPKIKALPEPEVVQ